MLNKKSITATADYRTQFWNAMNYATMLYYFGVTPS